MIRLSFLYLSRRGQRDQNIYHYSFPSPLPLRAMKSHLTKLDKEKFIRIITDFPWESVKAQGNSCKEVPGALLRLLEVGRDVKSTEHWDIENVVVVQGGLYEGAFYVIPFLIQMVGINENGTAEILDLLFEIANGSAEPNDVVKYSVVEVPFFHYVPNQNEALIEPLSIACRGAVLKGFSRFVGELNGTKMENKERALGLLCSFVEHHYVIKSLLKEALEKEASPVFKVKIAEALSVFCK